MEVPGTESSSTVSVTGSTSEAAPGTELAGVETADTEREGEQGQSETADSRTTVSGRILTKKSFESSKGNKYIEMCKCLQMFLLVRRFCSAPVHEWKVNLLEVMREGPCRPVRPPPAGEESLPRAVVRLGETGGVQDSSANQTPVIQRDLGRALLAAGHLTLLHHHHGNVVNEPASHWSELNISLSSHLNTSSPLSDTVR